MNPGINKYCYWRWRRL